MNQDILNAYNEQSRSLTQADAERTATLTAIVDELFNSPDFEEKFVNACVKAIKSTKNLAELSVFRIHINCRMYPNFWNTATYVCLGISIDSGETFGFVRTKIKQFTPLLEFEGYKILEISAERLTEFLRLKGFTDVMTVTEPFISMVIENNPVSCELVVKFAYKE